MLFSSTGSFMFDTELLLRHTPEDAIVMMVNEENGTHFPSGVFRISQPEVVDGRLTRVRLTVRKSYHKQDLVPYEGSFDFLYHRLDLADHFRDVLTGFRLPLPTSTQVVLDELTRRLGQNFFRDDIVLEEIGRTNAAPYRLKAKAESLRWVGELEVWLAEPSDLQTFLQNAILSNGPTRLGSLSTTPQLRSMSVTSPFINATAFPHLIAGLVEGNTAQDQAYMLTLFQRAVPAPSQPLDPTTSPWRIQNTAGPFNLYNAHMPSEPGPRPGAHPLNPDLTHAVRVVLSTHCTNFDDKEVWIPYRPPVYDETVFTRQPRLTRFAVKSLTDGSAYARYLNDFKPGQVITHLGGVGGPFLINGPDPYVADPTTPGPRNLYGATVVYNGQVRVQDPKPADPSLNRLLLLALTDKNTAYRGNFAIHYKAPIVLPTTIPDALLNADYVFDLAPTGGVAPYTTQIVGGSLPSGHTLDSNLNRISGKAKSLGSYTVHLEVTDAAGTKVRYSYTYRVAAAPLTISGFAPDAAAGDPYNFQYTIAGGIAPYDVMLETGNFPPGVTIDDTARLLGVIDIAGAGTYDWTISATDAAGTKIYRQDRVVITEYIPDEG